MLYLLCIFESGLFGPLIKKNNRILYVCGVCERQRQREKEIETDRERQKLPLQKQRSGNW